ncbi:MAG: hypothetical protein QOH61_2440 [Chloroflexota bacterium]|nr:hypothetical protein [Chloroflexota bacterium]
MSTAERVVAVALVVVVMLVIAVTVMRGYRRGGYGPPLGVSALTRRGTDRTSRIYEEHGWAKPYDEEGRLLPVWKRELPDDHVKDPSDTGER